MGYSGFPAYSQVYLVILTRVARQSYLDSMVNCLLSHACYSIITNGIDYIFILFNTTIEGGGGV